MGYYSTAFRLYLCFKGSRLNQTWGNIQILLYLPGALVLAVFCYNLAVGMLVILLSAIFVKGSQDGQQTQ